MVLVSAPCTEATITGGFVASKVAPCVNYLRGTGGGSSSSLLHRPGSNTLMLQLQAHQTARVQTACGCLKTTASSIKGLNQMLVGSLPNKCGVSIPYPISPSTDCSKVQ
ncbi:hypothetical protein AQUCO_04500228v1 [Aquilegia coerulea]|uniref:Bifunctional inhibitor/plant lipid transfer protein/seed storage helical domain-containing protein n=1 Tax=Aquilegia coerulea TaxID=218851 RepID=A0A2G5CMF5_AQUCA|nr:hypothetical protein AQUCO_04500228v1 [Aquilegia coerulea]